MFLETAKSSAFELHHQLFPLGGERGQLVAQVFSQRGQPLRLRGGNEDA
jgi:hypothetical protein